jgi:outer membrane protein assembly factor BamA
VSFIPLPAIDTDPNAGNTYGFLPVLLFRTEDDQVKSIIAPSVTWNEFRGVTGTFRLFHYPSGDERVDLVASYSETIERELDLFYRNLGLLGGRFHGELQFEYERDATVRFFGLGAESRQETETNMTSQVAGFRTVLGVNMTSVARLSFGESLQRYDVLRGAVPNLPFSGDVFPDVAGMKGAFIHAQRVGLTYDNRDSLTLPTRGLAVTVYTEVSARLLGSDADYVKGGIDAVYLHPVWDGRVVLVGRGLLEAVSGDDEVPFQVLPTLGGGTTLRGFSQGRFIGEGRVLLNLEARIRLFALRIFGVAAEFQAAPFIDIGRVFDQVQDLQGRLEVTPGLGLRGLVVPSVVGHIEVGVSREGPAIFVGLDYPF